MEPEQNAKLRAAIDNRQAATALPREEMEAELAKSLRAGLPNTTPFSTGEVAKRDPKDAVTDCDSKLPTDPTKRKQLPIGTGVLDYFPDALAAVAEASLAGNKQHHDGTPLHWDKSKSTDEADCLIRHFIDRGKVDSDGVRHSAKMAWRALALLQREIDSCRR